MLRKLLVVLLAIGMICAVASAEGKQKHKRHPKPNVQAADKDKPDAKHKPRHKPKLGAIHEDTLSPDLHDSPNRHRRTIAQHEHGEARRIKVGIRQGELTEGEQARLKKQQAAIADLEKSFKTDGKLSAYERKQLKDALNVAHTAIWAERHDTDGNVSSDAWKLGRNLAVNPDVGVVVQVGGGVKNYDGIMRSGLNPSMDGG